MHPRHKTADEVLCNKTLIGCDLSLIEGEHVYRGPIKEIHDKDTIIMFELEWWAVSIGSSNRVWKICPTREFSIEKAQIKIQEGPGKQFHFYIQQYGAITIYCDKKSKLSPTLVRGLHFQSRNE